MFDNGLGGDLVLGVVYGTTRRAALIAPCPGRDSPSTTHSSPDLGHHVVQVPTRSGTLLPSDINCLISAT